MRKIALPILALFAALLGLSPGQVVTAFEPVDWYVRKALPGPAGPWIPEPEYDLSEHSPSSMEIYEVTHYPDGGTPSRAQLQAADDLVKRAHESAEKNGWFDFDKASADGFKLMPTDTVHYVNTANVIDDRLLDTDHPEFLIYYDTASGFKLGGFMFLARHPQERGPQIAGPLTVWHYHIWGEHKCMLRGLVVMDEPDENGRCEHGLPAPRSPEMIHVWLVDHPAGRFATDMGLPPAVIEALANGPDPVAPVSKQR